MNDEIEIRPYAEQDVDQVVSAAHESADALLEWMPWYHHGYCAADAAAWIKLTQEGHSTGALYDFAIVDRSGRYLGGCGLNQINRANKMANLGGVPSSNRSERPGDPSEKRARGGSTGGILKAFEERTDEAALRSRRILARSRLETRTLPRGIGFARVRRDVEWHRLQFANSCIGRSRTRA